MTQDPAALLKRAQTILREVLRWRDAEENDPFSHDTRLSAIEWLEAYEGAARRLEKLGKWSNTVLGLLRHMAKSSCVNPHLDLGACGNCEACAAAILLKEHADIDAEERNDQGGAHGKL